MIGFAILLAGTVSLMLAAIALTGWHASRNAPQTGAEDQGASIPMTTEVLSSVFSGRDWEFVREINSLSLEKLFHRERKRLALMWVAETSAVLTQVMREHALAARHSSNLKPLTELNIFGRYLSVLVVCGLLSLAIRAIGPLRLGNMAQLANTMTLRISDVHRSLQAAAQPADGLAELRS